MKVPSIHKAQPDSTCSYQMVPAKKGMISTVTLRLRAVSSDFRGQVDPVGFC